MLLPKPDQIKSVVMLATIAGVAYVAYKTYTAGAQAIETAGDVLSTDLNPASNQNFVYQNLTPDSVKNGLFDPVFSALGL